MRVVITAMRVVAPALIAVGMAMRVGMSVFSGVVMRGLNCDGSGGFTFVRVRAEADLSTRQRPDQDWNEKQAVHSLGHGLLRNSSSTTHGGQTGDTLVAYEGGDAGAVRTPTYIGQDLCAGAAGGSLVPHRGESRRTSRVRWRPIRRATRIVRNSWPTIASTPATKRAVSVRGEMSPYPSVLSVTKLKYR